MVRSLAVLLFMTSLAVAQDEPPKDWIDPDTGHKVIRLSTEPGTASLYFHQNAYSADGKKLLVTSTSGLSAIDLATHAVEKIVEGRVNVIVTGRKTGHIYYTRDRVVYATDLATKTTREVVKLPLDVRGVSTINAD